MARFVNAMGESYRPERFLTFNDVLLQPQKSSLNSRNDKSIDTGTNIGSIHLDIPFISANMDTVTEQRMAKAMYARGGLGIIHRFYDSTDSMVSDMGEVNLRTKLIILSMGINGEDNLALLYRLNLHKKEEQQRRMLLCVDVAHGHMDQVADTVRELREQYPYSNILAGNVATARGATELMYAGANIIKVGVGSGSICTTRIVTGHGVPMITAIMNVVQAVGEFECSYLSNDLKYSIVADGGIRNSGDVVKALAAGADAVMLGRILAGTDESPGEKITTPDGRTMCQYRGQSSQSFLDDIGKTGVAAEGVLVDVEHQGPVGPIIERLAAGVRSGFTYSGVRNIKELQAIAEFIEISHHGWVESNAHATSTV